MKKFALLLPLVLVAGIAHAGQTSKHAAKATTDKVHDVTAEVVSVDTANNTITIKGATENTTAPVEGKAIAALKTVKAGETYVLKCRDDAQGAHKAVTAIHKAPAGKTAAKSVKKS